MIHRITAVLFAGLIVAAAPQPQAGIAAASNVEPRAAAWAISISGGGAAPKLVQVGDVSSDSGSQPSATASSFMVNGQGTGRVAADMKHPDASGDVKSFTDPALPCSPPVPCDPGGSFTVHGGFAEAHVTPTNSNSRAGIGSGSGNGFAFASKNFSFDQQKQLLDQIQMIDDKVFGPINSSLIDTLNPLLAGTSLQLPHLNGIPPAGLIDFADSAGLTSVAQTSKDTGFDAATANTTIGDIKLLGGFIELHNVTAVADSESNSGSDSRSASAKIGSMTIAGLDVTGDSNGLHLAGNDLVKRAALQPAFDTMMTGLKQAGITITTVETKALGDLREVTAFDLSWVTPSGLVQVSIGHAEASAASVGAPVIPVTPGGPPFVPPPSSGGITPPTGPIVTPGGIVPGTIVGPPPGAPSSNFVYRRPGADVARALHTVYLIFLVAGLIGSLLYPMFLKRAPHVRRRPLLV